MKDIITVVGARPQFIKAAVLSRKIRQEWSAKFSECLIHTGQHYDDNMSDVFFREMDIPEPDVNLGIGSGTHGRMTGEMLIKIEEILLERKPDWVLVYGDTNSTLAGALAASKLNIPVAHVEAGLRSYFRQMPEEQNRIATDHLSSLLFCPTEVSKDNLVKDGISSGVHIVGDIMLDAALYYRELLASGNAEFQSSLPADLPEKFYLITLHRAENTDDTSRLQSIVDGINNSDDIPAVFPMHPRTRKALALAGVNLGKHIRVIDPVGYLDMLSLESSCECIVTDSGGVQKEAYFAGKPCITLRDQTEWVETVDAGWNTIVGADTSRIETALANTVIPNDHKPLYGTGDTGRLILDLIYSFQ